VELQTAHESSTVGSLSQGHQLIPEPSLRRCGNHAIADCCQGHQEKKPPQEAADDGRARQWQQHFALLCFLSLVFPSPTRSLPSFVQQLSRSACEWRARCLDETATEPQRYDVVMRVTAGSEVTSGSRALRACIEWHAQPRGYGCFSRSVGPGSRHNSCQLVHSRMKRTSTLHAQMKKKDTHGAWVRGLPITAEGYAAQTGNTHES
jgi:hypothetical protein